MKYFANFDWDETTKFVDVKTDTQGFVAVDEQNVVVSFRGTEMKVPDILTDLRYVHHDQKVGKGHVHDGFADAWKSVREELLDILVSIDTNNRKIWFTGHSLGAALATLASRDLPVKYRPDAVHTFGSPRVGSPEFVKFYKINHYRFVNEDDIVPHVPFQGFFVKYGHVGKRQIMQANGKITSMEAAWNRLLLKVAKIAIFGVSSLPTKAVSDHSMDNYIKKLANHYANR